MTNTRMRDWRAADGQLPLGGAHSLAERTFRQGDIPSVRRFAVEFGTRAGMRSVRLSDFVLAVSEAAACTVAGGPCTARLRLWASGPRVFWEAHGDSLSHRGPEPPRMRPRRCAAGCCTGSATTPASRRVPTGSRCSPRSPSADVPRVIGQRRQRGAHVRVDVNQPVDADEVEAPAAPAGEVTASRTVASLAAARRTARVMAVMPAESQNVVVVMSTTSPSAPALSTPSSASRRPSAMVRSSSPGTATMAVRPDQVTGKRSSGTRKHRRFQARAGRVSGPKTTAAHEWRNRRQHYPDPAASAQLEECYYLVSSSVRG